MERHRNEVVADIGRLEQQQDDLLDSLNDSIGCTGTIGARSVLGRASTLKGLQRCRPVSSSPKTRRSSDSI
jgi:hypothetical protein